MGLHSLITSQFPRDYFGLVSFGRVARAVKPEKLPEMSWDFEWGTNMQHALLRAGPRLATRTRPTSNNMLTHGAPPDTHTNAVKISQAWLAPSPARETGEPGTRESGLFSALPVGVGRAMAARAYAERLKGIDPVSVTTRPALARLPVLRKSELPALHKAAPPFGGFVAGPLGSFGRLFTSPGPIFEPEAIGHDVWRVGRAMGAHAWTTAGAEARHG